MIGPVPPQLGGMESFVADLLGSKLTSKYQILHLDTSKLFVTRNEDYKVRPGYAESFRRNIFLSLASYALSFWFFCKFLYFSLRFRLKIIHIHSTSYTSFWDKCPYILVARLWRKKVILHMHGPRFSAFYEDSGFFIRALIRYFLNRCHAVLVLSRSWEEFFLQIVDSQKVHVVPNGIDLSPFQNAGLAKTSRPSLLFLGEVSQRKGIYDLFKVILILKSKGYDYQLNVVGPGEIFVARDFVEKLDIEQSVSFAGPLRGRDKIEAYTKAWCFVLPSYAEGMPISIIEAFAAGLPVISTTVGGIPELVTDGVNGYITEPGDVDEMAQKITLIMEKGKIRKRITERNRNKAASEFNMDVCADRIAAIYDTLLDS